MQFQEDLEWQINGNKCFACKNGMALDERTQVHMLEDGWQTICLGCYDRFMENSADVDYEEMGAPRYED